MRCTKIEYRKQQNTIGKTKVPAMQLLSIYQRARLCNVFDVCYNLRGVGSFTVRHFGSLLDILFYLHFFILYYGAFSIKIIIFNITKESWQTGMWWIF